MNMVRLEMPWGSNLYRYSSKQVSSGLPARIEHFNRNQEARKVLGRWSPCPNINVAKRICDALARQAERVNEADQIVNEAAKVEADLRERGLGAFWKY